MTTTMASPRDNWLIQLRAQRAAASAIARLAKHGIDALPVKGIVTSRTLYQDVSERILTDVDLKVRPSDFGPLLRVGRSAGWPRLQLLRTYRSVVFEVEGVPVDVETTPSAPWTCAWSVDDMILRARPDAFLGIPHLVPELHDHAVVLVLNVFKDKLFRAFRWAVRDLEVLPRHPSFQPAALHARLAAADALTAGAIVARWLGARGIEAWREIADRIGPPPRPRIAWVLQRMLDREAATDGLPLRLATRAANDSAWRGALAVATASVLSAERGLRRWINDAPPAAVQPPGVFVPRAVRDR